MTYGALVNRCLTGVTCATQTLAVISKTLLSVAALRYYFISERTITNRVWTPHICANVFDVEYEKKKKKKLKYLRIYIYIYDFGDFKFFGLHNR